MKCPDCRNSVLVFIENFIIDKTPLEDGYYKCPKCKQEFDLEDLEEGMNDGR